MQVKPTPERQVRIKVRVPDGVLDAVKDRAKAKGMPYTRYIRLLMERDIAAK
jgi:predicted DNA binding CopG/RHH family protein